ncbi:MAG: protein arginine kinase [Clostridia bacterium]|nr:protein arginine kinase [Clostridia bacterium]MBR3817526.1 protein arginine kinase [Clostridia bacterium]
MNKWYLEKGDQGDIVISTRIRLARNLYDFPFPAKLDINGKNKVNELIKGILFENDRKDFSYIEMKDLSRIQAVSLAESHLISPEFASKKDGSALVLSSDESVSIMLCEEDHIRLQVMKSGLALEEAYDIADKLDRMIDGKVKYAFDERIGYLTQCPTNLGTAMRASVMLHLPALTRCGQMTKLANTVSKLGLTIRGANGEGSQPIGDMYQISNQITLGITEETAIANLKSIVLQLISQERAAAAELIKKPAEEDKIFRAFGILRNARLLSTNEFMELISIVRLGAAKGLVDIPIEKINELTVSMQPATISASNPETATPALRDAYRAKIVREALA